MPVIRFTFVAPYNIEDYDTERVSSTHFPFLLLILSLSFPFFLPPCFSSYAAWGTM